MKNGGKVADAKAWWEKRRPEIVEDFDREVYGRVPKVVPKVEWRVASTAAEKVGGVPVTTKSLVGRVDNSAFPGVNVDIEMSLTTPDGAKGPVPVIIEFGFRFPAGMPRPPRPPGAAPDGPTWQEQLIARGWGYAILVPNTIQADNGAGLTKRHHRPREQGPAAQARRLGRPARVGLGREPRARLPGNRPGRRREAGGHRGPVPLRQGRAGDDGVRAAVCDRVGGFVG